MHMFDWTLYRQQVVAGVGGLVPALGGAQHSFPYLSGGGRLVLKNVMLMAGSWLVLVDSARAILAHAPRDASVLVRTTPTAIPARP